MALDLSEATITAINTAKQSRATALEANSVHKASVEKLSLSTQEEAEKAAAVATTLAKATEDAKAAVAALSAELGLTA